MKPSKLGIQLLSWELIFSLALAPASSAHALRQMPDTAGLEERLGRANSKKHHAAEMARWRSTSAAERVSSFLNLLRSAPAGRGKFSEKRKGFRDALVTKLSERLRGEMGWSVAQAAAVIGPFANKLAKQIPSGQWEEALEKPLGDRLVQEVRRLQKRPASLTPPLLAKALPRMHPKQVESFFTDPNIPREIRRSIATRAVHSGGDFPTARAIARRMVEIRRQVMSHVEIPEEIRRTIAGKAMKAKDLSIARAIASRMIEIYPQIMSYQWIPKKIRPSIASEAMKAKDLSTAQRIARRMVKIHRRIMSCEWIPGEIRSTIAIQAMNAKDFSTAQEVARQMVEIYPQIMSYQWIPKKIRPTIASKAIRAKNSSAAKAFARRLFKKWRARHSMEASPPELPSARSGLEEGNAPVGDSVPVLTRIPVGGLMERLNQWLIDRGPVRRNTVHYGEGDILFRVIQSDGGYHIVGALVEEKWVRRHAELDERLERPTHPERYRKAGRLLVRVYLDRYRFDNGRKGRAIFIERLQIVPGPLRLEYTRELEIRRELLEAIGEWGRSNGIAVYMMRPEVIREVRRGLKEKTIKFNYYRPVEPAVWGTETLIVKNSAFVMPEKPYRWFIYLGREPVAVSPAAGAEEDQFKDRLSPPAGGLEELPEPAAQAEEATRAGAEEAAVATEL